MHFFHVYCLLNLLEVCQEVLTIFFNIIEKKTIVQTHFSCHNPISQLPISYDSCLHILGGIGTYPVYIKRVSTFC